jgi:nitrate/nitrite transporter NarK
MRREAADVGGTIAIRATASGGDSTDVVIMPGRAERPGRPVIVHAAKDTSWLTRNVWVLSAVSFLQDTASELLYPLLPIYLTTVLGAPPAIVGAVEGAAEGAASLTKLAAGPLGDRFARRPLIAAGYGMAALGKVIVAVAGAWPGVLTGRVIDRVRVFRP